MTFHLMFVHNTFSSVWDAECHLLGKSCPLGWPYSHCILPICNFTYFPFWFRGWGLFLIAPVPVRCLLVTFNYRSINSTLSALYKLISSI